MKKSLLVALIIILIIVAIIAYIAIWPWIMLGLGISLLPNPPKPAITHGEFPFRLVYEINGETKVIEDTLICEYDGIGMDEGQGKYRQWKKRLASGNEKMLLLKVDGAPGLTFNGQKTLKQEIYYDPGPAAYYMGEYGNEIQRSFPNASICEEYPNGLRSDGIIRAGELFEKYRIKLISWDIAQPIQNTWK